jgi:hypothetical protein
MKKIIVFALPFFPLSFFLLIGFVLYTSDDNDALQEKNEDEEDFVKVAIVENRAYWVVNNTLYAADLVDGEIEKEYAEPINAFDIDYKEVGRLMGILDNIQNWEI